LKRTATTYIKFLFFKTLDQAKCFGKLITAFTGNKAPPELYANGTMPKKQVVKGSQ
jgi:hypothetical protein